jgi:hypothetical protein
LHIHGEAASSKSYESRGGEVRDNVPNGVRKLALEELAEVGGEVPQTLGCIYKCSRWIGGKRWVWDGRV